MVSLDDVCVAGTGIVSLGPAWDLSPAPGYPIHSRRVEDKQMRS